MKHNEIEIKHKFLGNRVNYLKNRQEIMIFIFIILS